MSAKVPTMVQFDAAPAKRRKYKVRLLLFIPMFFFGFPIALLSLFSGNGGQILFWLLIAFMGFIGMIASAIGHWLAEP
jgi:hypothetical protein